MLDELPELARRLKVFVRENPLKECGWGPRSEDDERKGFAAWTADLLIKSSKACRAEQCVPVENEGLSLAQLRSYENRVNIVPVKVWPGSGIGLVRVCGFSMGRDIRNAPRTFALLEYSPLGWPELPDMAEADLNVLFEEIPQAEIFGPLIDPKDAAMLRLREVEIPTPDALRREWGFP